MTQHTPGPWTIGSRTAGGCWRVIDAPTWDAFAKVVIKMTDDKADSEQGLANARLIAAAPDLLAALKRAREILPTLAEEAGCSVNSYLDDIDAAVEKAEGRNV